MIYYKVKVIKGTEPNAYHIVNTTTNVTHSMWRSLEDASTVMRDLNSYERRKAKTVVRSEPLQPLPLRLVK
jgi:hypothetical protein